MQKRSESNSTGKATRKGQRSGWMAFWVRFSRNKNGVLGALIILALVLVAVFAELVAPHSYSDQDLSKSLLPPLQGGLLGTDQFGRDLLSRLIYGSRASIEVGLIATGISIIIGTSLGAMAGYLGGWFDYLTEALVAITWAFPTVLMALFLVSVLGPSLINVMLAVGLVNWAAYTRVVRSQVLALKEADFVLAARLSGVQTWRLVFRHLVPNALSPVIVMASLGMANAILTEAALSFLGLGIQPPTPSWGSILADARSFLTMAPWLSIFPGVAIMLTVLGFNLLGDGLRDVMDPRSRQ